MEKDGRVFRHVFEYAGERPAVLAALAEVARQLPANGELRVDVHGPDRLGGLLTEQGIKGQPQRTGGTVKAMDFSRTMAKLRPYFAEHLPAEVIESLDVAVGWERVAASCQGGLLEIDGEANMLWTLLGAPPDKPISNVRATGAMQDLLSRCLPIPWPAFYVNVI
jgi:hypothetical protein